MTHSLRQVRPRACRRPQTVHVLRRLVALVIGLLIVVAPATRARAEGAPPPDAPGAPTSTAPNLAPQAATRLAQIQPIVADIDAKAAAATKARDDNAAALADVNRRLTAGDKRLQQLAADAAAAQASADDTKERLGALTAALYAGGGQLSSTDADNSIDDEIARARENQLSQSVGIAQRETLERFLAQKAKAEKAQELLRQEKRALETRRTELTAATPSVTQAATQATALADRARRMLAAWQSVQLGTNTPIMGKTTLSAEELTAFFNASYRAANITVTIDELARIFIEEGTAEGVRGDIAFAQSILETGGFSFPAYGQLKGTDNNFAGIGACDSCPTGYGYPDARTGVRAQIQLLRNYADPSVTAATLRNPPLWTKFDQFFLRGKAPTWQGLTGTWASSTTYGPKIFDIYYRMLNWVTDKLLLPQVTGNAAAPPSGTPSR